MYLNHDNQTPCIWITDAVTCGRHGQNIVRKCDTYAVRYLSPAHFVECMLDPRHHLFGRHIRAIATVRSAQTTRKMNGDAITHTIYNMAGEPHHRIIYIEYPGTNARFTLKCCVKLCTKCSIISYDPKSKHNAINSLFGFPRTILIWFYSCSFF